MVLYLVPLDLSKNELRNPRLHNLAAAPADPVVGQVYFDTTAVEARVWNGTEWVPWARMPTKAELDALGIDAATLDGQTSAFLLARENHTGLQAIATVTGLQDALDGKAEDHGHPYAPEVHGHDYAATGHDHDTDYAPVHDHPYAPDAHNHDADYASGDHDHDLDYQALSEKGQPDGYASLDGSGQVPTSQLPDIAIGERFEVASEAAMLALTAQIGDVAVRSDNDTLWLLIGSDPSVLSNWHALVPAEGAVESVGASAPITSTGGVNPVIGLVAEGIQTGHIGDGQVTPEKLSVAPVRKHLAATDAGTSMVVTHNFNTRWVTVQVFRATSPYDQVITDVELTSINSVTVRFAQAVAADEYMIVVTG